MSFRAIKEHVMDRNLPIICSYVRGDLEDEYFEEWLYSKSDELNNLFEETFLLDVLATDFSDPSAVDKTKEAIRRFLLESTSLSCKCLLIRNRDNLPLNFETSSTMSKFVEVSVLTPWLTLKQCSICSEHWLVGIDTVDDEILLSRVSGEDLERIQKNDEWPTLFNNCTSLWPTDEWLRVHGYESLNDWRLKLNRLS